jgi:L-ascorbate metabolism protein UlaG (beta-lactamase superfamily)
MKLFYYGHSCFSVTLPPLCGGARLLFDPFFTSNPKAQEAGLYQSTPEADYVLLSHGHFDHVEDAVPILRRTKAVAIAAYEVCEWLHKHGVPETQLHRMNIGGNARFAFGSVQMVQAVHSSSMPDGSPGGNPAGFVVRTQAGAFYYSGDTALTLDMQLIPKRGPLDFAVLSLGDTFTMDPEDALEAARFIGCDEIVGVHFNTWPPIAIDQEAALTLFSNAGKRLHLPAPGAELSLGSPRPPRT